MASESGYDIDIKNAGINDHCYHVHRITDPDITIRAFKTYEEAEGFIDGIEHMAQKYDLEGWAQFVDQDSKGETSMSHQPPVHIATADSQPRLKPGLMVDHAPSNPLPYQVKEVTVASVKFLRAYATREEADAFIKGWEDATAPSKPIEDKITGLSLIEDDDGSERWKILDRKGDQIGLYEDQERATIFADGAQYGMQEAQKVILKRLATMLDLTQTGEFVLMKD